MSTDESIIQVDSTDVQRHRFLTFMLWWLVIGNIVSIFVAPFLFVSIRRQSIPDFPEWAGWVFAALSIPAALCAAALFHSRKWGFFGYALVACAVFALNVYGGVSAVAAALGFGGTILLFIALQIGGEKRAWPKLR